MSVSRLTKISASVWQDTMPSLWNWQSKIVSLHEFLASTLCLLFPLTNKDPCLISKLTPCLQEWKINWSFLLVMPYSGRINHEFPVFSGYRKFQKINFRYILSNFQILWLFLKSLLPFFEEFELPDTVEKPAHSWVLMWYLFQMYKHITLKPLSYVNSITLVKCKKGKSFCFS